MNNVINFIIEYWYIGLGLLALVLTLLKRIRYVKREDMIKWLVYAFRTAEIRIEQDEKKLKMLYDIYFKWYPLVSQVISYDKFKDMVKEALEISQ